MARKDVDGDDCGPGDPTPADIAAACLRIQHEGFVGTDGETYGPWSDETRRARRLHVPGEAWQRCPEEFEVEPITISLADISAAAWDRAA